MSHEEVPDICLETCKNEIYTYLHVERFIKRVKKVILFVTTANSLILIVYPIQSLLKIFQNMKRPLRKKNLLILI